MFAALAAAEPDEILAVMAAFRADPRADKIDLGVGVYRDAAGETPVFAAIKAAETRLLDQQPSKTYVGLLGDMGFCNALGALTLGEAATARSAATQAVGGSGALFVLGRLIRAANPGAVIHLPTPTWPNHRNLLGQGAGLSCAAYPYLSADGKGVDLAGMEAALDRLGPGDVVVLHASCHNPTGVDMPAEGWEMIARSAAARGWLPFFDAAYLGFAEGPEADAAGMRLVLDAVPEAVVAVSCSKTFGMYRDRVGAAFVMAGDASARAAAQGRLAAVNREHLSMPPDHGAAAVRIVLEDADLRASWGGELAAMRGRINGLRQALDAALGAEAGGARWRGFAAGRGLFATLPLDAGQIGRLRDESGIYVVPGGRVNVAGLPDDGAARVAAALAALG
ncbi:aromatic amino acid transaminase [Rhodovulum sp. DZ06]|uniref:amino acid aminotransferase n=1 Tax=Rhodovulum sp. DZ06 TaxID=3425126 RepID=UPI003D344168